MSNLQLFTEPGGDGGGSREGDGAGAGGNPGNSGNTTMSFDEFLALEGNQSEFDRRVQKAVNTAVTNAQTKWKTLTDDKVSAGSSSICICRHSEDRSLREREDSSSFLMCDIAQKGDKTI